MYSWPRFGYGNKGELLVRLGSWLQSDAENRNESKRTRLLAQSIWVAGIAEDLAGAEGRLCYRQKNSHSIGYQIFTIPGRLKDWLPSLMRVRWSEIYPGSVDFRALRHLMVRMLLMAPDLHPAAPLIEQNQKILIHEGDSALFKPSYDGSIGLQASEAFEFDDASGIDQFMNIFYESNGDPKKFERCLTEMVQNQSEVDRLILQQVFQEIADFFDQMAWPLRLMSGLVLAHWCFSQTGIDSTVESTSNQHGKQMREAVVDFLNDIVESLKNQPLSYQPAVIAKQWDQIGRLFSRVCQKISELSDNYIDAPDKRIIIDLLKTKKDKLSRLQKGLERRLQAIEKEPT